MSVGLLWWVYFLSELGANKTVFHVFPPASMPVFTRSSMPLTLILVLGLADSAKFGKVDSVVLCVWLAMPAPVTTFFFLSFVL